MPGVGKTVLFDHINGTAYKQGYQPPGTSGKPEKRRVKVRNEKTHITVIPGQEAAPRLETINQLFLGKKPVDGVVHVVSNGFITLREGNAQKVLVERAKLETIEQYRTHQLREELRDLDTTCQMIRQSLIRHRKPMWMLVAVTKADLYYETISQAEKYYAPTGDSLFVERLKELELRVGRDNFQWAAEPVAAWLEDFEWNNEKRLSILKPNERDYLISKFARHLERFCES